MFHRYQIISLIGALVILFSANIGNELLAQTGWTPSSGNPVMDFGPSGSWDEGALLLPFVIQDGDTLKMWYAGSAQSHIFGGLKIGYAWSLDGINWTRFSGNPVMTERPGEWDDWEVADPVVIKDGDTLRMWYGGRPLSAPSSPAGGAIGYATSENGINWNRLSAPVLERGAAGEWDDGIIVPGKVIKEGNTYKMWYSGGTGELPSAIISIGYATSSDGINWTKYDDPTTTAPPFEFSDPVLLHGGSGEFDEGKAWTPSVLPATSGYELWYAGDPGGLTHKIGYATSSDGIHWTKDPGNPVFEMSEPWTNNIISPNVMRDGSEYHMWFSGFQPQFPFAGRIGYAISAITGINDDGGTALPKSPVLHQNYPNPFNPATTIAFNLSHASRITLHVYDMTGKKVRTLINGHYAAGHHTLLWNGTNDAGQAVSSGVYFYRLEAGNFRQTRKMLLVR